MLNYKTICFLSGCLWSVIYFIQFILGQYFTIYTYGVPVFITSVITMQMRVNVLVIEKKMLDMCNFVLNCAKYRCWWNLIVSCTLKNYLKNWKLYSLSGYMIWITDCCIVWENLNHIAAHVCQVRENYSWKVMLFHFNIQVVKQPKHFLG